ncbi:hypothetical protein RESH_01233 [Rhodopirellula europaea SH398]|uniref:Uncharacterized protein n=1 Tax=Rhodopirellula europaea SH398 TaxID=1263868 RepID=M5S992_9BACT|nr:hypothetical protein RESH_01233 [Rhodopirellula europaea SH398]
MFIFERTCHEASLQRTRQFTLNGGGKSFRERDDSARSTSPSSTLTD